LEIKKIGKDKYILKIYDGDGKLDGGGEIKFAGGSAYEIDGQICIKVNN